jgi:prepilin-type N-terminal cleavage/methylation domain-containing protein
MKSWCSKSPAAKISGFTLVELMVVVGIIGILSAVAIPSFKKYQLKSRTAEAKIMLSAMHTAQQNAQTDWGTYVSCLWQIGIDDRTVKAGYYAMVINCSGWIFGEACFPDNTWGNPFVRVNFNDQCQVGGPASKNVYQPPSPTRSSGCVQAIAEGGDWALMNTTHWTTVVDLTQSTFIAWAGAYIGNCSQGATANDRLTAGMDAWSIDQQKKILNVKVPD